MAERVLVLGGTRSGKSAAAERLVADAAEVVYIATAQAGDPEMAERVAAHRARRPDHWQTVETCDLTAALHRAPRGADVLVDALGGWLVEQMTAHGLWAEADADVAALGSAGRAAADAVVAEAAAFWDAAASHPGRRVVVAADEAGLGVVPAEASTRRWLDLSGTVVQRLAATADRVLLVVAGRVLELPGDPVSAPARLTIPATAPAPAGLRAHGDTMVPPGCLDLAVNVHGDAPPAHLRAALDSATGEAAVYPDPAETTAAVAARHRRRPSDVLLVAGAAEAFWLLARVVQARLAAVVHPAFTEPEAALRAAGVPVTHVLRRPEDGWALDPVAVPDTADLVVVANPNNPTGRLDDPEVVAKVCRPGRVTVVDEAFVDFVADPHASLARRRDLPGLVVVRSVTKLWGLAGVRAGYLVALPGLVARCAAARQPWSVGVHALAALRTCAGDEAYRRRIAGEVAAARAELLAGLRGLPGVQAWDGAANFVLVRVPDGPGTHAGLLARGVAVRPSTFPGLDTDHLRITVRDAAANRRLLDALAGVLDDDRAPV